MVMLMEGSRFKAEDVKNGEIVRINSVADWVKDSYKQPDESVKVVNSLIANVTIGTVTKDLRITKASRENLKEAFGPDTANWVGKEATVMLVPTEKGKSIMLTPIAWEQ